jgi:N-carbamoylputrescine amidase
MTTNQTTNSKTTKNKRIGLIQMSCVPDTAANLDKAADRVREAARAGANVICLPELFRAQYFCQREEHALFDTAESIPGPSTERLSAIAKEEKVVVIASLFERRAPGLYHNTAAILETDGSIKGIYRKMHIPDDPLYYEKFYFTPGDLGFKAMKTTQGDIGTLVCWDQWYPEAARETALRGANTLFYPTAIGWHPSEKAEYGDAQYSAWQTTQRAHAISNGVFVGAVNRVGHEHGDVIHNGVEMLGPGDHTPKSGLEFWGGSFIADPFGRVIAQASHDKEEILIAEIDLKLQEDTRRNWPFLRDRRIDAYNGITSRFID